MKQDTKSLAKVLEKNGFIFKRAGINKNKLICRNGLINHFLKKKNIKHPLISLFYTYKHYYCRKAKFKV